MRFERVTYRKRESEAELNFASMIDVIFLLLVFFFATATITLPESRLSPALQTREENAVRSNADFTPQVIKLQVIDEEPVYVLGGRTVTDRHELTILLTDLPKDLGVIVEVQDQVPVWFTASAIQCCRDAEFENVTYVPEP